MDDMLARSDVEAVFIVTSLSTHTPLGMKAVLFTAVRDVDRDRTSADAVCDRHADLPAIIDKLAAGA